MKPELDIQIFDDENSFQESNGQGTTVSLAELPRNDESLVLVVEDDAAMLRFIRRTLEVNGLAVVVAKDGPSALEICQAQRPDLVVLDIGIPKMDGLEVCRRIKAHDYAPVILVTARNTDEDIVTGFEVGAEDYLAKPFAGSVLVARVKSLLRPTRHLI